MKFWLSLIYYFLGAFFALSTIVGILYNHGPFEITYHQLNHLMFGASLLSLLFSLWMVKFLGMKYEKIKITFRRKHFFLASITYLIFFIIFLIYDYPIFDLKLTFMCLAMSIGCGLRARFGPSIQTDKYGILTIIVLSLLSVFIIWR